MFRYSKKELVLDIKLNTFITCKIIVIHFEFYELKLNYNNLINAILSEKIISSYRNIKIKINDFNV